MRTLFLAVAFLACLSEMAACDVCGCSAAGNYFGILPGFHRNFVGLRWTTESSRTALSPDALRRGQIHSMEQFNTLDIWARMYVAPRWQLLLTVPYRNSRQTESGRTTQVNGLGDISVYSSYLLLDGAESSQSAWNHTLNIGGGVKLPTGRQDKIAADGSRAHPNLQTGTGSTDILATLAYVIRRNGWGGAADLQARLTTANARHYRFGNRLSGSIKFFYWSNPGAVSLLPHVGLFVDAAASDTDRGDPIDGSAGITGYGIVGLDVYAGRFSTGLSFQPPLWQSRGTVQPRNRWTISVNYIF
ncbi:MAG: hypothetical protein H6574_09915 [Lewinellaceae bacterium]|nr:hypothetical protein [Lewinellaceae bacterium]